jgi:hypothetical protein
MYVPLLARTVIRTVIAAASFLFTPADTIERPAFPMPR